MKFRNYLALPFILLLAFIFPRTIALPAEVVENTTIRGKVLAGYQAWFRCPGDDANMGWVHWFNPNTTEATAIPRNLHTDLFPDMDAYRGIRRYPLPGFTDRDGKQSYVYSGCDPAVVRLHFQWMRDYDIDGAVVQLWPTKFPGQPLANMYPSAMNIVRYVRDAAEKTGRVWAIQYDLAGAKNSPQELFSLITDDWQKMVDGGFVTGPRYLRNNGLPCVFIWDFIAETKHKDNLKHSVRHIDAAQIKSFIDYFHKPGKYQAFLIGGGSWSWKKNFPDDWKECAKDFDAYIPWNVGNFKKNGSGDWDARTDWWPEDKTYFDATGAVWMPAIYPGFSWNHQKKITDAETSSTKSRRKGQFFWDQWYALKRLNVDTAFLAMFDEVDEGTAIYKCANNPPMFYNGKPLDILPFVTYEDMPSDWYLRLVRAGRQMLRGEIAATPEIPIKP
jgi:hypothetical protein